MAKKAKPKKGAKKKDGGKKAEKARAHKPAKKPARKKTSAAKKSTAPAAKGTMPAAAAPKVAGVKITGEMGPRFDEILTPAALHFLAELHRKFDATRKQLLARRVDRQHRFDAGELPDFLPETKNIRDQGWKVAPIPKDLLDRRVEITGPVDRKMVINALNSGAEVYMADFEDACSPSWDNLIDGQINLKDRWSGKLDFVDPQTKKAYKLSDKPAVLIVRPRGWHLLEDHVAVDGASIAGALFDFGLYLFHNAKRTIAAGTGPYFYLPKMESHLEARLWNEVFVFAQSKLGLPLGTIKATVLIETLPAAFEMDEILYEMRDHITGLNAGRWDYIFSFIKRLGKNKRFLTPDRAAMTMDKAFLHAYSLLLIRTCHRRGAFAMGGMAAQIPVKGDPSANEAAFKKVRADKEREAGDGHDGTWVAHPDLVPVAEEVFHRLMKTPNQLDKLRNDVRVARDQLLEMHQGERTEEGLRLNIRVGVQYIEAWLRGRGAVPLYHLMEDAATAEISRAQVWQWIYHGARLADGREVTADLFETIFDDEMEKVRKAIGPTTYDSGRFDDAVELFKEMSLALEIEEFLTIPAYRLIA
ncbi:MAG TPA: malate synthase A [Xanthobacteraceae bacterium]|nr:malate synthase A [Xanthobacteraceae bacterium]